MKTALITGFDEAYRPLAILTIPRMAAYAKMHGFDFRFPLSAPKQGIYWVGVVCTLEAFQNGYDRVIYLDADQMVTNFETSIGFDHGFHVSRDWGKDAIAPWDISMCGFIAHRDSIPMFEEVLDMEPHWRDKPFPEQAPFRDAIKRRIEAMPFEMDENGIQGFPGMIYIHPQRTFNAVPLEVHPSVTHPYQTGDFCAHLTMLPLEDRIKLFHKIANQ